MGSHNLPSPPAEGPNKPGMARKSSSGAASKSPSTSTSSSSKHAPHHRISKHRATPHAAAAAAASAHASHAHHHTDVDGRHKRVWKACERCRMKKTKCDGEFPCKRCKDDGLVCTAGVRKKIEYKQLPKGYAEVLENTQLALIATVHKLYAMVRASQPWELGEPELNDRGQPVIHNIAQKLGCIRPNSDIDLPVHSVFPEDEGGMRELAMQLEEQQRIEDAANPPAPTTAPTASLAPLSVPDNSNTLQTAVQQQESSSDLDHSDLEQLQHDYRAMAFGNRNPAASMSPQSFTTNNTDYELSPHDAVDPSVMFPPTTTGTSSPSSPPLPQQQQQQQVNMSDFWQQQQQQQPKQQQQTPQLNQMVMQQLLQQQAMLGGMDVSMLAPELQSRLMNQGLVESEFGTLKPHVLSGANSEVMMGMGDPMIFAGFDGEL